MVFRRSYLILLLVFVLSLSGCFREAPDSPDPLEALPATNTPLSLDPAVSPTPTMLQPFTSTPVPIETVAQPTDVPPTRAPTVVAPPTAMPTTGGSSAQPEDLHTPATPITPGAPPSTAITTATPVRPTTTPIPTPTDRGAVAPPVSGDGCVHVVVAGENLFRIALNAGFTIEQVKAANPGLNAELIQPGDEIVLPSCGDAGDTGAPVVAATATEERVEGGEVHYVTAGETLLAIARRYGVRSQDIIDANPKLQEDPDALSIGQRLFIPLEEGAVDDLNAGMTAEPVIPAAEVIHTVVAGETLGNIARQYGVTQAEIINANPGMGDPNRLSIGQELVIPPVSNN